MPRASVGVETRNYLDFLDFLRTRLTLRFNPDEIGLGFCPDVPSRSQTGETVKLAPKYLPGAAGTLCLRGKRLVPRCGLRYLDFEIAWPAARRIVPDLVGFVPTLSVVCHGILDQSRG